MSEKNIGQPATLRNDPAGDHIREGRPPVLDDEAEKLFAELAHAASLYSSNRRQLEAVGFKEIGHGFQVAEEGRIRRTQHHEKGSIYVRTQIDFPKDLLESMSYHENPYSSLDELREDFEKINTDPVYGAFRFMCGRVWYTMIEPWTPQRLLCARRDLSLAQTATQDKVEGQLHFRFQQLYHKPPDEWSDAEVAEWELLCSYVDAKAYNDDNPPTDNRIGKLQYVDAEKVIIRWNSKGEVFYDAKSVPADLIVTNIGWLIHAEFHVGNGAETWLSTWVEPPISADELLGGLDSHDVKADVLQPANWPNVPH